MAKSSFVSAELRSSLRSRIEPIARLFGRVGLTPNALTVIGLVISTLAAIVAANESWFLAGLLVAFGAIFDLFDGALARATGTASKFGAFLDSTLDRAGEAVVYLGIAVGLAETRNVAPGTDLLPGLVAAFAAMAASFMVSYARAKAESLGFSPGRGMANVGLAPREIRIAILTVALLIAGRIRPYGIQPITPSLNDWWVVLSGALTLIAVLATITTIQRILAVRAQASDPMQSEDNR
jgi:phosphatidylglycerophosphate synthase